MKKEIITMRIKDYAKGKDVGMSYINIAKSACN